MPDRRPFQRKRWAKADSISMPVSHENGKVFTGPNTVLCFILAGILKTCRQVQYPCSSAKTNFQSGSHLSRLGPWAQT